VAKPLLVLTIENMWRNTASGMRKPASKVYGNDAKSFSEKFWLSFHIVGL
jgi:hypothetical protein